MVKVGWITTDHYCNRKKRQNESQCALTDRNCGGGKLNIKILKSKVPFNKICIQSFLVPSFHSKYVGNNGNSERLLFGAPKSLQMVTAAMKLKDVCSLQKKVMTNLDSILKSRDITLPTKVLLVKVVVFPVVMNGCESWIVKKDKY